MGKGFRIWELTPSQAEQAAYLRSMGKYGRMDPRTISKRMNVSEEAVRRALSLNPKKKLYDEATKAARKFAGKSQLKIPEHVIAERDNAYMCDDTTEIVLMGGPRPGRSAWEQKMNTPK